MLLASSCDQLVPGDLRDDLLDGGLLVLLVAGLHLPQREVEGRHWFQRFLLQTDYQDQHNQLCHHFSHHNYHQVSTSACSTAWSTRSSISSSTPPSRPKSSTFSGAANSKRSVLVSRRANQMCFSHDAVFLLKISKCVCTNMKYTAFGLIDFDCTSFRLVILIWGALKTIKTFILIVKWFQECFKSQTLRC